MTRILFVHGRSQQDKSSEQLREEWMPVLERGLENIGLSLPSDTIYDFPFYGKQLVDRAEAMDAPLTEGIRNKGGDTDTNYLQFRSDMFEDIRIGAGITDAQINEEYGDEPLEKGIRNWEWVQRILLSLIHI